MADVKLKAGVISGGREFRSAVAGALQEFPDLIEVVADVQLPAARLDSEGLELLHEKDPELMLVDFDGDPASALRFVRLLSDARPSRVCVASGPELSPALLLDAMRAGVSEYLPTPAGPRELAEALRRASRKLGRGPSGGGGGASRIVVFAGVKGGVGASTAAVNAAAYAATLTSRKVLLLDLELEFGNAALLAGVSPRYSVLDLIENLHRLDESLLGSLVSEHESGLHVLPAPAELVEEGTIEPEQLRTVLRLLRQHYALVVVDLARPLSSLGTAVLNNADEIYLVVNADLPSLRNAKRYLPHVRRSMQGRSQEAVHILLNRFDEAGEIGPPQVASAVGAPVALSLHRDEESVLHSVNVGTPIVLNGSRSRYRQDARALGLQLARLVDADVSEESTGVLRRLTSRLRR